jgi:hypothetical protein
LQQAQVTEQQASSRLRKKPTISKAGFRLVQHSFGTSIHAPKKQANIPPSQNLPNTPPPCDEDWVKSPPPPPPGIVITPIERTEHRKLPLPTDSAPKAISETPDHSHQQCIPALTTLPPSPFVGHDNPPRKEPETVEEFQAKINRVDDVLGSASVLLSVYNEELDEITKEETLILRRLEAVQATKRSKQERVTKKRAFMDEKTIILKDLRERRNNLIAEMVRFHLALIASLANQLCTRSAFLSKPKRKNVLQDRKFKKKSVWPK